jgi:hypothetical protein
MADQQIATTGEPAGWSLAIAAAFPEIFAVGHIRRLRASSAEPKCPKIRIAPFSLSVKRPLPLSICAEEDRGAEDSVQRWDQSAVLFPTIAHAECFQPAFPRASDLIVNRDGIVRSVK